MPKSSYKQPDAVRLGAILHRLRVNRGWTLVKMAQRTGMNPTYLGVMEKGGNMPTIPTSSSSPTYSTSPPPTSSASWRSRAGPDRPPPRP